MSHSSMDQAQMSGKIHALTSLRFFAALYVVCYHTLHISSFLPGLTTGVPNKFLSLGYISVSFFFLLSGYILSMVYLRKGTPLRLRSFYLARFARIYPLYLLTTIGDTPNLLLPRIAKYGIQMAWLKTVVTFLGNLLMLQAIVLWLRGINNPSWSLSVEALFYISFPLLGTLLWKLRGPRLIGTAALIYVAGQLCVYLAAKLVPGTSTEFFAPLHVSTFLLGILLARWQWLDAQERKALQRNEAAAYMVTIVAACAFAAVVWLAPASPNSSLCDGLLAPIYCAFIWAFSNSEWRPARLLSARWLVLLGEASFGLYLIHMPILHIFETFGWVRPEYFAPYISLCIGLSVISFLALETPSRRWLLKRGHTQTKETMEVASAAQ